MSGINREHSLTAGIFPAMSAIAILCMSGSPAEASEAEVSAQPKPNKVLIEIYRIAPGKHEAFLRKIASYDEANRLAGLPARQLYVHSDGANWDFLLIQPASTPVDKAEALDAAWKELGLPEGARFFLEFRQDIVEHSDTFAHGPTSAAQYLAGIDQPSGS